MKQEINSYQFERAFKKMDRDYYSYNGYKALYNYLDEFDNFDLDVIAICCDFTEYDNFEEFKEEYLNFCMNYDLDEYEEFKEEVQNHTTFLELENGGFIIQNF